MLHCLHHVGQMMYALDPEQQTANLLIPYVRA